MNARLAKELRRAIGYHPRQNKVDGVEAIGLRPTMPLRTQGLRFKYRRAKQLVVKEKRFGN